MAEAAQRSGNWDEAEFALKSALGMQPDNVGLQLRLGEVFIAEQDLSAARDVFRKITESSPHSDRGWAALGLLEARLGNHDRALDDLDRAIAENPLLPEVQLARGELLLVRGDNQEAMQALESAANLLHDDAQLAARMGQALLAVGRAEEALPKLRAAVDQGFAPDDVQRALALALALNGRLEESDRVLSRAGLADNGDTEIVRGVLMLERSSYAAAEEILSNVTAERANEPEVLNLFAATLYNQGRYAEAVNYLEAAVDIAPSSEPIADNLKRARAARAAELLAEQASTVKAAP
jgi:tetratricopeptide (TPR) repeat protein